MPPHNIASALHNFAASHSFASASHIFASASLRCPARENAQATGRGFYFDVTQSAVLPSLSNC